MVAVAIIFPITILCASQGKSTKLKGSLLLLGSASYPMYVLHEPAGEIMEFLFKSIVEPFAPISGIVFVFVLVAVSVWLEKYYEIPLRRKFSNYIFTKASSLKSPPSRPTSLAA